MTNTNRLRALVALPALLAMVMGPATALAAEPVFNGQPNDYPTLQVGKAGGDWKTAIDAEAGDTLSLLVWDHNSVPDTTAHNVTVKVSLPDATTARTNHSVSATVSADNAAAVSGSVAIKTADQTKLSFVPGSIKLYKNTGGENPVLTETTFPAGVNLADLFTTGINLGDQMGCWQYAKAIILQVKLTGVEQPVEKGVLRLTKDVRRGSDNYTDRVTVNPGERVEYRIMAENIDERGTARNIKLQDFLPANVNYVAGSGKLTKPNGETISFSDGITAGMVVLDELKPGQKVYFTFLADTAKSFTDGQCVINRATVTGDNTTNSPEDTADVCFVVKPLPTPTPTPVPTPVPAPHPTLPKTGPEAGLLATALVSGMGLSTGRYALLKRKVKRQARNIDIV
ncbi:MAG: hypothetical protein ACAH35_03625 [Candidatus Paceibacterota bacterium]